jgi:hypothetical protein
MIYWKRLFEVTLPLRTMMSVFGLKNFLVLPRVRLREAPGLQVGSLKHRQRVFLFELSKENVYN